MSERILLTGSSGFTGRYLLPLLLANGHEVVALRSGNGASVPDDGCKTKVFADICRVDEIKAAVHSARATMVIHMAGESQPSSPDLSGMLEANVIGAKNLLDALSSCDHPPKRVILASSSNIYGPQPINALSEDLSPRPVNVYGCSKLAMEMLARTYVDAFEVLVVRPFNYTGLGQPERFVVPKIVSHFRDRLSVIRMGNPQNARDFSDVRDVSEIYARLIDVTLDERFTIVNMTSGKVHTLREIITVCEALTDHTIKVEVDPRFVRKNDPLVIKASTDVLSNLIGTIPSRPLEDTLSWMLGDNVQPQETGVKTPAVDR